MVESLFPYLDQCVGPFESLWFPDHVQNGANKVAEGWTVLAFALARYPDKLATMLASTREDSSMAIRITRVYTRTGDKGDTALVGGRRVPKDAPRIEAYGTIDELNSIIGLARVFNAERLKQGKTPRWLDGVFRQVQNELFDLGSELATPDDAAYEGMHRVGGAQVKALEALMDQCQKDLAPLKSFVLPGGGRVGGFLHQARTVCRRAERRILALSRVESLSPWPLAYVNRLSDLLFVLSRWVGKKGGETEYLWERGLASHARKRT